MELAIRNLQPNYLLTLLEGILSSLIKFPSKKRIILKWLSIVLKNMRILEINIQKYEEILHKFQKYFSDIPTTLRNIHFFKGKYNLLIKEENYADSQKTKENALKRKLIDKDVLVKFKQEKTKKIKKQPKKTKKITMQNNKKNIKSKNGKKRNEILTSESLSDSEKKNALQFQQNYVKKTKVLQ